MQRSGCLGSSRVHDDRVSRSASSPTPRQRVDDECRRRGKAAVVAGCIALLERRPVDPELIIALGGRPARWAGASDDRGGPHYWLRVWAARGLLWAWDDVALPQLVTAMSDEAWRVREMAAKVVARNDIGDALAAVSELRSDPVVRVRAASARDVARLTTSGA